MKINDMAQKVPLRDHPFMNSSLFISAGHAIDDGGSTVQYSVRQVHGKTYHFSFLLAFLSLPNKGEYKTVIF